MILITRPKKEALKLQKELADLNIKSIVDPMLSYTSFESRIPFAKKAYYLVASVKAVEALFNSSGNVKNLKSAKFITIGNKSAKLLKNNNICRVIKTYEDSSQLIESLSNQNKVKKLFYLCGSQYNKIMLEKLKKLGIQTQLVQVYKTIKKNNFKIKTINLEIFQLNFKQVNKCLDFLQLKSGFYGRGLDPLQSSQASGFKCKLM